MQPLDEGEFGNLVKIMSYLVNVRDRAQDTEFMFEPLRQIVELLLSYDVEFSEETYRLLQVRELRYERIVRWLVMRVLFAGVTRKLE